MKLLPSFYQVAGPPLSAAIDATAYLLPAGDALYLIDCGAPEGYGRVLANIRALGYDPAHITRIYGTHGHYDHVGAASLFHRDFGASLHLHEADRAQVQQGDGVKTTAALLYGTHFPKTAVHRLIAEGDTFQADAGRVEILHTPGHSMGSCCFILSHASGMTVLIGGDALHGGFSGKIGSDESAWRASLDKICARHYDCYTFGHCNPTLLCDADRRLDSLRRSFANYYNPWFKNFYGEYPY